MMRLLETYLAVGRFRKDARRMMSLEHMGGVEWLLDGDEVGENFLCIWAV